MLNHSRVTEDTLDTCKILRDLNLRDYEDTQDQYFKGKADAYTIVINLLEALDDVKTTE
jgi:hypothetical protein